MTEEKTIKYSNQAYLPDVLGNGFEQLVLHFKADYEGEVIATLIRKKAKQSTVKAVLYIHGYNDYFFQAAMANRFIREGYHFYALDLRKYGRSFLPHQKLNNVRSLSEYDEEIQEGLRIIKAEGNTEVILLGHSTGGLIVTHYAGRNPSSNLFHGIICNSPFYEFNLNFISRKLGIPIVSFLSRYFPNKLISTNLSALYGHSIHYEKYGEWNYSLSWKPHQNPKLNASFINAIHIAHNSIQNKHDLAVPALVMYSSKSIYDKNWSEQFMEADAVLNVKHIRYYAERLQGNVTTCEIENGMHDLVLSKESVRENVYESVFSWIHNQFSKS